ncbi:hypothetical protein [Helicobacter rodentium]|uniref:hypothetical protein n=1 Tax=Helicobacter rodentium TaxID=59617 RepID=UPI00255830CF|nr:hypothetical protein [Helicobacter rodentium]
MKKILKSFCRCRKKPEAIYRFAYLRFCYFVIARFRKESWQSIILNTLKISLRRLLYARLWIASSFTAFIPRNDAVFFMLLQTRNSIILRKLNLHNIFVLKITLFKTN